MEISKNNSRPSERLCLLGAILFGPYYLLKERRQQIGFEGENLENQKRSKIIDSGKTIKLEHIMQKPLEGDPLSVCATFLVESMSHPGNWYDVDIVAYTCTCLDFPVISFCKHIYAVQTFFPTLSLQLHASPLLEHGNSTDLPPTPPTILSCQAGLAITLDGITGEGVTGQTQGPAGSIHSSLFRDVSEKLERLAAQFRLHGSMEQALRINSWLDAELTHSEVDITASQSLLPVKQKLSPRLNSWPETQASMMPSKKKRSRPTGDKSYGAGQASGKKAKTLTATQSLLASVPPAVNAVVPAQSKSVEHMPPSSYYRPKTHLY